MKRYKKIFTVLGLTLFTASCTYYTNEPSPVSEARPTLEARHVSVAPNSINAAYWATAAYLVVDVKDIKTHQVASEDGLLNVNGMYNGVSDFNGGQPAGLTLKAAYDDEYLYILASWNDKTLNVSGNNWYYNGPADSLKDESSEGWTSQGSDDELILAFNKSGNTRDIWKWSLALSEPMGYAIDMYDDGTQWSVDAGDQIFVRNSATGDYRSGPEYEWNGKQQDVTRNPAGATVLDPLYFLLNKTEFTEDVANGDELYQGNCSFCHGSKGQGHAPFDTKAISLVDGATYNRSAYTSSLNSTLSTDSTHAGAKYWNELSDKDKMDVFARIRAFNGIPGYYLQNPSGSASDIRAVSNIQLARMNTSASQSGYKVLLIRKLNTGKDDDEQFDLSQGRQFEFDVYLTDNDNLNLVGAASEELTFK